MALSEQQFIEKMNKLSNSQQSIETISGWCCLWRSDARSIANYWESYFAQRAGTQQKRLCMLYLANDILQTSRKKGPEFVQEFFKVLPRAIQHFNTKADDKHKASLKKLLRVWDERKLFGKSSKSLLDIVESKQQPPSSSTTPDGSPYKNGNGGIAGVPLSVKHSDLHVAIHLLNDIDTRINPATKSLGMAAKQIVGSTIDDTMMVLPSLDGETLRSAQNSMQAYTASLMKEVQMRESAVQALKKGVAEQEKGIVELRAVLEQCKKQEEAIQVRLLGHVNGGGEQQETDDNEEYDPEDF